MADGKLLDAAVERVKREALAAGLTGGLHSREHGGQGWTRLPWALVAEQFGRSTNAIHWHVPNAYNVWAHGSTEQIDRHLRPALRGELRDAYAVTERDAGSDPSGIETVAEPDGAYRLSGEKWFVTSGDVASVIIVMANVVDGDERLPTLFLVEVDAPGVSIVEDRASPTAIPTVTRPSVSTRCRSARRDRRRGRRRDDLQREWFTEERLGIAAHGIGRCGDCSTRRSSGRRRANGAATGSSTSRG